jgi:hypothetical protein
MKAVKMVIDISLPIAEVACDLGINEGALGNGSSLAVIELLGVDYRMRPGENDSACAWLETEDWVVQELGDRNGGLHVVRHSRSESP